MEIEFRLLKSSDKRGSFSCGEVELDYFFQRYAGQNQFKNYIGSSYVLVGDDGILAFSSVSAGALAKENLPKELQKRYPNYPLPIMRITRIATELRYQGLGLGRKLMREMFLLALKQKELYGCIGVAVDAKESAVEFYKKLGFVELQTSMGATNSYPKQIVMFVGIASIEKAMIS